MAAQQNNTTNGSTNYYNISYGKLNSKVKEIPNNTTEITESELKEKTLAVENVDLRNKYLNKGKGERPYVQFFDSITGSIQSVEKQESDNGTSLAITLRDTDLDSSIVQVKFYSKYSENLLNRLMNCKLSGDVYFQPYAIPNESVIDGRKIKFYTQGVLVKENGIKVEPFYKADSTVMPATQQVKVGGKASTSRDARLDFLFDKFMEKFESTGKSEEDDSSSLPF
jgi:hypothetical protein